MSDSRNRGVHLRVRAVTRWAGKCAPLTFQQEWAVKHWMPLGNLYVMGAAVRMVGSLDVGVLSRSIDAVVERHDALRTRIARVNGAPELQIYDWDADSLEVIELSEPQENGSLNKIHEAVGEIVCRRPETTREPLSKFTLLRVGEREHLLVCVIQHIVCDAVSRKVFLGELWREYGDLIQGHPSSVANCPRQYSDYAISQRSQHAQWLREHENYWRSTLAGATCVRLPYDQGLEGVARFSGAYVETSFSVELSCALHLLARQQQVSIATVLLSIYGIALSLWSAQEDFVIPFAASGRCGVIQMRMIGQFAAFMPLRLRLSGDEAIGDMFKRVSNMVIAAGEHFDFGRIVTECPDFFRGTSLNWIPDTGSTCIPTEWNNRSDCPSIAWFPSKLPQPLAYIAKLTADMGCKLSGTSDRILCVIRYRADLFRRATMIRFLEDLKRVGERVVQDPSVRVSTVKAWLNAFSR